MTTRYNLITRHQRGFTLVEMATVLIIIGLLLGMAFKGRDLIDGARVKSLYASANKIQTAMQVFYERYQAWPGDGCSAGAADPAKCTGDGSNPKDGLITTSTETSEFWSMLIDKTGMLAVKDRQLPTGGTWAVAAGDGATGRTDMNSTWLVADSLGSAVVDIRYVCALDQQFDDGDPKTGHIRSDAGYDSATDCWKLSGPTSLAIRILP